MDGEHLGIQVWFISQKLMDYLPFQKMLNFHVIPLPTHFEAGWGIRHKLCSIYQLLFVNQIKSHVKERIEKWWGPGPSSLVLIVNFSFQTRLVVWV